MPAKMRESQALKMLLSKTVDIFSARIEANYYFNINCYDYGFNKDVFGLKKLVYVNCNKIYKQICLPDFDLPERKSLGSLALWRAVHHNKDAI